ncbi:hypothetical protein LIER_18368 [Lithospermum erythrorhizon]|uniref:Uncharacterized protein n=1 Tax=Lithospermum erythrorhizon TaxID=34254 RepID=A0AAV3QDS1_LITER
MLSAVLFPPRFMIGLLPSGQLQRSHLVTIRGTVITSLEAEEVELALKAAALEKSIETGRQSRVEQLGLELSSLSTGLRGLL